MENSLIASRKPVAWNNSEKMDSSFMGIYIYVEGEKDQNIWKKYTNKRNVRINVAGGWEKVVEIVCGCSNKIGIIDKDFRDLTSKMPKDGNIFLTDEHDIEMMMFLSNSFSDVILALRIADSDLRANILTITDDIGRVKLSTILQNWNLTFKRQSKKKKDDFEYPKYEDALDKNGKYAGIKKIIERILVFSKSRMKVDDIIPTVENCNYPLGKLSNGHDFALIMQFYLKTIHKKIKNATDLEEMITAAYLSADLLKNTNVYKNVMNYGLLNGIEILIN
ncbi:MAG: DUF4435 domain-containing protein [Bacteroidales bacterium]|nr:DUF4435 domain-containing protein [Bacteroidales bacterium]MBR4676438.1 DUF4435 domain-containing protein [Bacteroidales bacterium]